MAWTPTALIDKTDQKYGVVATLPFDATTVSIWQDITNPPLAPLDMDVLRLEVLNLTAGFYAYPEHRIFAEIIANGNPA